MEKEVRERETGNHMEEDSEGGVRLNEEGNDYGNKTDHSIYRASSETF